MRHLRHLRISQSPLRIGFQTTPARVSLAMSSKMIVYILVGFIVLATSLVGSALLTQRLWGQDTPPSGASLSGITAMVTDAGWLSMDAHSMDQQGGYQMPAQMMPGAPAGDEMRLGIRLTLHNTSRQAREFKPSTEFTLLGGPAGPRAAHSDTFGNLTRINPGHAVDGIVYFDTTVPATSDQPLLLRWDRGGDQATLAISIGGQKPDHHGK